jgi:hypothetical protein
MGYGSYSHDAHQALLSSRATLHDQEVFKQRDCHPLMNTKGVRLRESHDSKEHPNSLGIAFALDVTGSMGDIPRLIARRELPRFMKILTDCGFADAQILFTAVGDATSDRAPLQVGQFESTAALMDQWLTWTYLEGAGGGSGSESYELAMYFLAEHTEMDCWVKRKKRGYMFMTGDELPYPAVSRIQVDALIGDRLDDDIPTEEVVAVLRETYHPFFLIPDLDRRRKCERDWRNLLGDHVICMESPEDTCFVSAGLVALTEGHLKRVEDLRPLIESAGAKPDRINPILRAVTPYAASLGRDGAPAPRTEAVNPAPGGGKSLWKRLFSK